MRQVRRCLSSALCFIACERFFQIEAIDALRSRIGDYGNSVITDHRVSFICSELPNGQTPSLFVLRRNVLDEIACAFLIDDRVKRMSRAKSVPQGEDCVVGEVVCVVNFEISSAVATVNVHEEIWRGHRVIEAV